MQTISDQEMLTTYRNSFPAVAGVVKQLGGDLETAKDLFHDALIIYWEKKKKGSIELKHAGETTYLAGIVKNLWNRQFRYQFPVSSFDDDQYEEWYTEETDQSEYLVHTELLHFLQTAGKKCMELLQAYYYDQQSMQEIARQFKFSSPRSATVQKFKCLEKLRQQLKTSGLYEAIVA